MKKILLISNKVFHYRQCVYNYFSGRFLEEGYEFHVLSDDFQEVGYECDYFKHVLPMSVSEYTKFVKDMSPDVVILFLHLKDKIEIPLMYFCKMKKIPVVFWNKGLSDTDPHNPLKKAIYHHIHNVCDALITYTPDMVKNFKQKNRYKLFVANNTINCTEIDKTQYSRNTIKNKYGIKEEKVILYVSRLLKSKRVDVLLKTFSDIENVAVVVMGEGITAELQRIFDNHSNLYYVGQRYGSEGNEIWAIGDVFSIPVNVGLGINEALFWEMPTITMDGFQPPEIYYLKNGETGYIVSSEGEYKERVLELLKDEKLLNDMRENCRTVFENEASIEIMFLGFLNAIESLDVVGDVRN